ncbi:DUF6750 family protein [Azohydromonas australica]|uniref:DUF6750 family protein n=1 Tax=Azohydromonas australica TaxID=364039 RepID=UPI0003F7C3DC|nr:DUF6750 family protein [Azohydromonas australica]
MNLSKFNPMEVVDEAGRFVHVKLTACAAVTQYSADPQQRRMVQLGAAVTLLGLAAGAHAAGFADMFTAAATQADSMKVSLGKMLAAGGFGAAGYGGYNWWRKGKEGENSQVKGGQIVIPFLGGAALGGTGFVLVKAGETVGITGLAP